MNCNARRNHPILIGTYRSLYRPRHDCRALAADFQKWLVSRVHSSCIAVSPLVSASSLASASSASAYVFPMACVFHVPVVQSLPCCPWNMASPCISWKWTIIIVQKYLNLNGSAWVKFREYAVKLLHAHGLPNNERCKEEINRLQLVNQLRENLSADVYSSADPIIQITLYHCLRLLWKSERSRVSDRSRSTSCHNQQSPVHPIPMTSQPLHEELMAVHHYPQSSPVHISLMASQPLQEDLTPSATERMSEATAKLKTKPIRSKRKTVRDKCPLLARDIFAESLRSVQLFKRPARGILFSKQKACTEKISLF